MNKKRKQQKYPEQFKTNISKEELAETVYDNTIRLYGRGIKLAPY